MTTLTTDQPPQLERFTHADAWNLGQRLVERCARESFPVTISIVLGTQRVFHAALAGTSADNDAWVARKIEVVRSFDRSSQAVERYAGNDPHFQERFGLSRATYAAAGGAVPIRVGGALVGVLAISGLDSDTDHQLAFDALVDVASAGGATRSSG